MKSAIRLDKGWRIRDETGDIELPIDFPTDLHTALHRAGVIPEPYRGRNEYDCRWVGERDWVASRSVELDGTACDLVLSGLDTIVEVRVNGRRVLRADNAFRTWRVDLTEVARRGENRIELHLRSPVHEAARRQRRQPFFVPWSTNCCQIPDINMLRKQQSDFGWDWGIALAPLGVAGRIAIEPRRGLRIDDLIVTQRHADGAAEVTVEARFQAAGRGEVAFGVTLCGRRVGGRVDRGSGRARATLRIPDPDLWWPAGQGAQALHDLEVELGDAHLTRRIGLRDLRLVTESDATGLGFRFRVNGRDLFAKGANWVPADALFGRIRREAVRDLLQSAVQANMNMIRVWGGGRYEPDWFYDLCDELGLMVWQDFMFACNLYPCDDAFLDNVREEVRENVARLHHHASLALWCGDNEMIGALDEFEVSRQDRDRYLVAYDRLNRTIETALKDLLPDANWWPSSPSLGPLDFGDAWHRCDSGDMHSWEVWHEGRDFDHYFSLRPRFCSEFGFQSYPSPAVIRRFAAPEDMNIASPVMESHQKNAGGNARIAETMFRYFRFPVDFENFAYVSQIQQGLAIKTAVGYWRSLKPHCMGTLYWQLNDTWPACSWSSIDHGGDWKLLHYMARDFFAPVVVSAVPEAGGYRLMAVSDRPDPVALDLVVSALDPAGGLLRLGRAGARLDNRAALEAMRLDAGALPAGAMLHLDWSGDDGTAMQDVLAPGPWKALDLRPAGLEHRVARDGDDWRVTVRAAGLGLFVTLEADRPGRFARNGFHLLPGREETVVFRASQPGGAPPRIVLRDLYSATCAPG